MPRQFPDIDEPVHEIAPADLKRRLDDGEQLTLLDTRRPEDFRKWQLTHENLRGVNVPFTAFLDENEEGPAESVPEGVPDEPLVTSCGKGISSTYVAQFLSREGWNAMALVDGMEGWAALNELHHVPNPGADAEMAVHQFHRPSSGCLSYLLIAGEEAAVVDPLRAFTSEYARAASDHGARLRYAIDTHVHADHVSGVRQLAAEAGAEPVLPAGATDRGLSFEATLVEAGESLPLGAAGIEAEALPGHTTEMTGYWFGDVLCVGDTVFLDSVARPDLEDPEAARVAAGTLWETLQSLAEYPEKTVIAPGHAGPTTRPGAEGSFTAPLPEIRETVEAFEDTQEEFVRRTTENLPPRPENFEEIIAVNLGHEDIDSETAFELELGPNNCAVE